MSTSGTYEALSPQSVELITESFERIGIIAPVLTKQQISAAQRSINLILSSWINRGLNLWTVKQSMIALNNNQNAYSLPVGTSSILEATIRTSARNLGGTAFSSAGGTASNAFDGNPNTACIQTAPDGYISYNWGQAQFSIAMVGVQSNATRDYTLVFEYSNDNATWTQSASIPEQTYIQGVIEWFVIPVPTPSKLFRVRETGGATLTIQELYFNSLLYDTIINPLSRAEWIAMPQKTQTGRPSSFYLDRQISPIVYIWPCPNTLYNNMFYTRVQEMQDIGSMLNNAEIPARFLEALCAFLAFKLGVKYLPDLSKISLLKTLADEEYKLASEEDRERVPLRIYGDYMQGWTRP